MVETVCQALGAPSSSIMIQQQGIPSTVGLENLVVKNIHGCMIAMYQNNSLIKFLRK